MSVERPFAVAIIRAMGTTRVTPDTLRQVAAAADQAYQRVAAAREHFAGAAQGVGHGFGKASLEGKYDEALTHAQQMADAYASLLQGYRDGLRAAAARYDNTDAAVRTAMSPS